jgi:cyanophycinase-like exopeptidase
MTDKAFALLGSGEFDPWTESVDRRLLSRPDAPGSRVLILPTASAAEGDDVFDMWANKGKDHYDALGIESQILALKTREDAARPEFVSALGGAATAFFSGGNPAYLAATLLETPFWEALKEGVERGIAYAGCSAGIACLGDVAPDSGRGTLDESSWQPGLRLFPGFVFGPHWDALDGFAPGLTDFIVSAVPEDSTLVAVDENTAIVGDGAAWDVEGVGGAHILSDGAWTHHAPGARFVLSMLP